MPEGPGLTIDEIFNAEQGVYLVEQARRLGWLNLIPGTSLEAYRVENGYLPDHPPLGRWWLGVHHHVTWWLAPPFRPDGFVVTACARTGSATAFALTVLLIGLFATRWSGRAVGILTAVSLVLMPRVYGHAHLAALESVTNLTCTAAVLCVAHWWSDSTPPSRKVVILTGVVLGLALLTKIQAVLIPIPVVCWSLWRWRTRAVVPLAFWGVTAFVVFFAGWPYLWFDSLKHLLEYLGRTTNRATIQVWYLGEKFPDKLVPWHYPFVIFGLTVPVVLHALGLFGLLRSLAVRTQYRLKPISEHVPSTTMTTASSSADQSRQAKIETAFGRDVLLLACTLFPLVVFALPGVAVYDGERLFLTSYPLWAIFVGRGWMELWQRLILWVHSQVFATVTCSLLLLQATYPLMASSPCHLCFYNELTYLIWGGVDRAGLEVDYWGEGITRRLLQQLVDTVPDGANVAVIPTMHQFQAEEYWRQSPILRQHNVKMSEYHAGIASQEFAIVYRRLADLPNQWNHPNQALSSTVSGDRRLAYIVRLDK